MNISTPFIVISAERPDWSDEINKWRSDSMLRQLAALPNLTKESIIPLRGKYDGIEERSFLVFLPSGENHPHFYDLIRLARRWGQESVLYVDANSQASFIRPGAAGNKWVPAGRWESSDGRPVSDYSQTSDGRYWHIVPPKSAA